MLLFFILCYAKICSYPKFALLDNCHGDDWTGAEWRRFRGVFFSTGRGTRTISTATDFLGGKKSVFKYSILAVGHNIIYRIRVPHKYFNIFTVCRRLSKIIVHAILLPIIIYSSFVFASVYRFCSTSDGILTISVPRASFFSFFWTIFLTDCVSTCRDGIVVWGFFSNRANFKYYFFTFSQLAERWD